MICIYCNENYNKVLNSRDTRKGTQIWRRRQCIQCKEIFTTYEMVDLSHLKAEKKDGRVERFIPIKIYAGILQACLYSKRADKGDKAVYAQKLTDEIVIEIANLKKKVIKSFEIRDLILNVLYKRAPEIFLRYLAYVKSPTSSRVLRRELSEFF